MQRPRVYYLHDPSVDRSHSFSYKYVLETPAGEYYGLEGTRYTGAPILKGVDETRVNKGRTFQIYNQDGRIQRIAWHDGDAVYWISNTLLQTLSNTEMLAIAYNTQKLPAHPHAHKKGK